MKFESSPNKEYLSFDDVSLQPQLSNVKSRSEPILVTHFSKNIVLQIPFVSSPMDTVSNVRLVTNLGLFGGIGILHRFWKTPAEHLKAIDNVFKNIEKHPSTPIGFAVGMNNYRQVMQKIYEKYKSGNKIAIVLDVAHGGMRDALLICEELIKHSIMDGEKIFDVVSGSISTSALAYAYINIGIDALRVGISSGSACMTRVVTGHGSPQLTAISDCISADENFTTPIISDGGIRSSGDIVKALACGANTVMLGRILAYSAEAGGWVLNNDNSWEKDYYGMASEKISKRAPEGAVYKLERKTEPENLAKILVPYCEGIKHGMAYSGALTLQELWSKARFARITYNGHIEGLPVEQNRVIS